MDAIGIILGIIDILSGTFFFTLDIPGPSALESFLGWFLIIKGISTVLMLPIWFGPTFRIAGWVDTVSGALLFFTFQSVFIQAHGIVLLIKGLTTIPNDIISLAGITARLSNRVYKKFRM